jgi:hypothetical protein
MMESVLGTTFLVFVGITVILSGIAAFLMGNAIAETWRPWWHNVVYGALLAFATQFMKFALFDGIFIVESLVSSEGAPLGQALLSYVIDAAVLVAIALFAYRLTLSRKMVRQYPWLYERTGPFGWRAKH